MISFEISNMFLKPFYFSIEDVVKCQLEKNRVDFFSVGNKLDVEFLSTDQFRDYQTFLASLSGFFMHHCFATPEI
jgi:hypothetical protein